MNRNDFYFFWSGSFSQWARYDMVIDGRTYGTCEQYMMAEKARLFGDEDAAVAIMRATNPRRQKEIGRTIRNFDSAVWDIQKERIVYEGNLAKFSQDPDLRDLLVQTGGKIIVEASPDDTVWGIGLAEEHPDAVDPTKWRGENLLGKAIMRVRETLLGQQA